MSLHCDLTPLYWPLSLDMAFKLARGRLTNIDMEKIIREHKVFDRFHQREKQEVKNEN